MKREDAASHLYHNWYTDSDDSLRLDIDDKYDFIESIMVAKKALQEKPKIDRSKWNGCEYCKADLDGYSTCFKDSDGKSTNLYIPYREPVIAVPKVTAHYTHTRYIEIHFCPFCGRPLTESAWKEMEMKINNG